MRLRKAVHPLRRPVSPIVDTPSPTITPASLTENAADYGRAVFAYNTPAGTWKTCSRPPRATAAQPGATQLVAANEIPQASCSGATVAAGPGALDTAVRLTFPNAYRTLPLCAMRQAGRPSRSTPASKRMSSGCFAGTNLRVIAAREA